MNYKLKEEIAKEISKTYKNSYISEKIGISSTYTSLIIHRHITIPKRLAYCFAKAINSEYEIEDLFERA